jgi:para-nitrobenzyl esterase
MSLAPMIDGDTLPQAPLIALQNGAASHVPILVGSTRDEWNLFLHTPGPQGEDSLAKTRYQDLDKAGLIRICERDLPGLGERAANYYEKIVSQRNPKATYLDMYSAFESDRVFRIPTIRLAEAQGQHTQQVFHYTLDWNKGVFGACHAADVPLIFGNVTSGLGQFLTGGCSGAQKLSATMQGCWIAFARSGNPATDAVGAWPSYSAEQRRVMCFDEQSQIKEDPHKDIRRFWDGIL